VKKYTLFYLYTGMSHFNTRFKYPPLYTKRIKYIYDCYGTIIARTDKEIIQHNFRNRKRLRDYMKIRNKSFKDIIRDGHFDEIIYLNDIQTLKRDEMILNDIPQAYKKRKEKLHNQRLYVSRIAMRGVKTKTGSVINLPSDLVPIICSFAVPESKKYNYM